jgi:hypothetical protein
MDSSIFMDKERLPSENDLREALGDKFELWMEIRDRVFQKYPEGREEWNFPGKKYGWSYRIKDKKRAILYLLPRDNAFMVAFVFGGKAFLAIMESELSDALKSELESARVYAEGRGIRIPVKDRSNLKDVFLLLDFKLAY